MTWPLAVAYLAIGLVLGLVLGQVGFAVADRARAWWQGLRRGDDP